MLSYKTDEIGGRVLKTVQRAEESTFVSYYLVRSMSFLVDEKNQGSEEDRKVLCFARRLVFFVEFHSHCVSVPVHDIV